MGLPPAIGVRRSPQRREMPLQRHGMVDTWLKRALLDVSWRDSGVSTDDSIALASLLAANIDAEAATVECSTDFGLSPLVSA